MKKWISMLLTLSLALGLAACGGTAAEEPAEEQETEVQEEQVAGPLESVEYTITTKDHSIRTEQGDICVEQKYDLVTLTGEGPVVKKINQSIQDAYEEYVAGLPSDETEIQGYRDSYTSSLEPYALINNVFVKTPYNQEGILCLVYSLNWWMGGVGNVINTAYLYDLDTGDELAVEKSLGLDEDILTYYLRDCVRKYILKNNWYEFYETAEETIQETYTLDYMNYYIGEDGQLYLDVQVYDLAPGYMGGFTIPCGIYLDDSKNRQVGDYATELTSIPVWSSYLEARHFFGEYRFAEDGTCTIICAYAETDVGVAWTGTWSVDSSGLLTLDLADEYDPSYTTHWEYQLVPVGDTLMLMQKSATGMMYQKGPGYGIVMFPESAI